MVTIKNAERQVISTSRNLRGVMDRARNVGILQTDIERLDDGRGWVCFSFLDGSFCTTEFADYNVLVGFLKTRRSWKGTPVFYRGGTFDI